MQEDTIENKAVNTMKNNGQKQIAGAIIIAGVLIAGAILLKDNANRSNEAPKVEIAKVSAADRKLGNEKAKVALVLYEDFQCPFCGAVSGLVSDSDAIQYLKQQVDPNWSPFMTVVNEHIEKGDVFFVYRDWPFLGTESFKSAEAARCAGDEGKFWEYHDYLYAHQNGENKGAFSNSNLKSFAKILNLNTADFNQCFDSGKHTQEVLDSKSEGSKAGVTGTPKGFILKNGKIVSVIDGAEPATTVKEKLEAALK